MVRLLTIVTVDIGWLAAAVEGAPVMDVEELIGVVHSHDVKVGVLCGWSQAVCSGCGLLCIECEYDQPMCNMCAVCGRGMHRMGVVRICIVWVWHKMKHVLYKHICTLFIHILLLYVFIRIFIHRDI